MTKLTAEQIDEEIKKLFKKITELAEQRNKKKESASLFTIRIGEYKSYEEWEKARDRERNFWKGLKTDQWYRAEGYETWWSYCIVEINHKKKTIKRYSEWDITIEDLQEDFIKDKAYWYTPQKNYID